MDGGQHRRSWQEVLRRWNKTLLFIDTHTKPSCSVPCWSLLAPAGPEQGYLWYIRHDVVVHCSTMKITENLLTFLWLILCCFGRRQPLTLLDFLIMQGGLKHMIILHAHSVTRVCARAWGTIACRSTPLSTGKGHGSVQYLSKLRTTWCECVLSVSSPVPHLCGRLSDWTSSWFVRFWRNPHL